MFTVCSADAALTCMHIQALLAFQIISTPEYGQSGELGLVRRPLAGSINTGSAICSR